MKKPKSLIDMGFLGSSDTTRYQLRLMNGGPGSIEFLAGRRINTHFLTQPSGQLSGKLSGLSVATQPNAQFEAQS
jgi:hypothetical protein